MTGAPSHAHSKNVAASPATVLEIKALVLESITDIERVYETRGATGLQTGFKDFDHLTGGLHKGELIVVGGRPSMGKTAFALNVVEHVVMDQKRPVAMFSLEMTGKGLTSRFLCCRARIDITTLRRGHLSKADLQMLTSAAEDLARSRMHVIDTFPYRFQISLRVVGNSGRRTKSS